MSEEVEKEIKEEPAPIEWSDFLESYPPSTVFHVVNAVVERRSSSGSLLLTINTPEIQLHCESDECKGLRFFTCGDEGKRGYFGNWIFQFLTYTCRNCQKTSKTFAIAVIALKTKKIVTAYKFGEAPPFGPPTPARVIKLIGPDRELFLSGRRAENQGMGIGSYVYYRRVVENQKQRIFDEIIRVAEKIAFSPDKIKILRSARDETQFSKAVDIVKDAIPPTLLINGHNPLKLLHSALSQGVHELSDEECLEYASSIRIVLTELAERLGQALKDEEELKKAVSKLHKIKPNKPKIEGS